MYACMLVTIHADCPIVERKPLLLPLLLPRLPGPEAAARLHHPLWLPRRAAVCGRLQAGTDAVSGSWRDCSKFCLNGREVSVVLDAMLALLAESSPCSWHST